MLLVVGFQRLVQFAGGAAGERDQAGAVFGEQFAVDARLVVEALEVGLGGELNQVAPALTVLGEQHEVVVGGGRGARLAAVGSAAGGDVGLHAEQGTDVGLAGGLVEIDGAVEVAVVGDGEGLLAHRSSAFNERLDLGESVEFAVFSVGVEMSEHTCRGRNLRQLSRVCTNSRITNTSSVSLRYGTVRGVEAVLREAPEGARQRVGAAGLLGDGLVEGEGAVEEADGFFAAVGAEEDGDADFAGRDQLDVDAGVGEGAEHERGVARR